MILDEWAKKWNISYEAIEELKKTFGLLENPMISNRFPLKEGAVQNLIKLEASQKGCRLWRNNVGALYTQDGSFLRYGLANESSSINKKIKSADLIGIKPIKITKEMIGITIGQFISREVKKENWSYRGTEDEKAQLAWIELINSLGGDACFANKEGTL